MSSYNYTLAKVLNRGSPKPKFLDELVAWGRSAPNEIFYVSAKNDVYRWNCRSLEPWRDDIHRRAGMLEVMRVLAGFESSWHWAAGTDTTKKKANTDDNAEAGAWQVSADSLGWGADLRRLVKTRVGSLDHVAFQNAMKTDHVLAMEYIARLLRHTVDANGPTKRNEIDAWLSNDAVEEFQELMFPPSSDWAFYRGHFINSFRGEAGRN